MVSNFLGRSSVRWISAILGFLLCAYVLLGVFWVPSSITGRLATLAEDPYGLNLRTETSSFNPFTFRYELGKTRLTRGDSTVLSLNRLSVNFDPLPSLYNGNLSFSNIEIDSPDLYVRRNSSGKVNLREIIANGRVDPETLRESVKDNWELALNRLRLTGGSVTWEDRRWERTTTTTVRNVGLRAGLLRFPLRDEAPFTLALDLGEGHLRTEGTLRENRTFTIEFLLEEIPLSPLNTFFRKSLPGNLTGGRLMAEGTVNGHTNGADLALESSVEVKELDLTETPEQTLASVSSVNVDTITLNRSDRSLAVRDVTADSPVLNFVREQDGSLNLSRAFESNGDTTPKEEKTSPSKPWSLEAGPTRIKSGTITYEDRTFEEPFRTRVETFGGTVGVVTLVHADTVSVELQARVAGEAPLDVQATISPDEPEQTMDLETQLKELSLPPLSPYTTRFVGHRIDGGKLHLALNYTVRDALLQGTNELRLNQFNLGEKINENPVISAPLKLAVALLKDRDRIIDLSIPVEGNLRNPDFQLQGTINQAIRNAVWGAVSSPYNFLAGLVDARPADLRTIDFSPGSHQLRPESSESLKKLAEALQIRPQLRLDIRPAWSKADRQFLSRQRLERKIKELGGTLDDLAGSRNALEEVFDRKYSSSRRRELLERHTTHAEGFFTDELDQDAYLDELQNQLLKAYEPDNAELNDLAVQRAETVHSALRDRGVPAERLYVLDRLQLDDAKAPVSLPLELSAK